MKFARISLPIIAGVMIMGLLAGCQGEKAQQNQPAKGHTAASTGDASKHASGDAAKQLEAHTKLTPAQRKDIEKDGRKVLDLLAKADGNAKLLPQGFMGEALKLEQKGFADDLAAGKVKVRRYGKVSVKVVNYINGLAGVGVQFVDQGYYVDALSKERISTPSNKPFRFIFAMKKDGSRWKVSAIFDSDTIRSDSAAKTDGTINKGTQHK